MSDTLKAPVGLAPRKGEGDEVRNNTEDVALVRRMLRANGYNVADQGGVDPGLLKAIGKAQEKAGFKKPDQVVDPGGKVFKALQAKYEASLKAAEDKKVDVYKLTWKGKEYFLVKQDYYNMKAEVFYRLDSYTTTLIRLHKQNMKTYEEYLEIAGMKEGFIKAATQAMIMKVGSVTWPDQQIANASSRATAALERALTSRSLELLDQALPEAERAVNAFSDDVSRFLNEYIGSAQTSATVLSATSAGCFAVVGVLATPVLVAGGMGATAATTLSGAGVAALGSATNELGRVADGQDVTILESVWNVAVDGIIGGASAGLVSKLPLGFVEKISKGLAPKLASKVPGLTATQLAPALTTFMTGTGEETAKAAAGELFALLGKTMKSGKVPSDKDIDDAITKVFIAFLTGGLMKKVNDAQTKWASEAYDTLEVKVMPDVMEKMLRKADPLKPVLKSKIVAEVLGKVEEQASSAGLTVLLDSAASGASESTMLAEAAKAVEKDTKVRKLVEVELEKALKRHKVELR